VWRGPRLNARKAERKGKQNTLNYLSKSHYMHTNKTKSAAQRGREKRQETHSNKTSCATKKLGKEPRKNNRINRGRKNPLKMQ